MSRIHVFFMFGSLLFNTISCMQMFTPNGTSSPVNDSIITNAVDSTERVDRFVANNVLNNNSSRNNYPVNKFLLMRNNPTILNKNIGANVLTSFIYSLTFVPLFVAITSIFSPWPHGFSYYGRYKRALVNESHIYRHLPLLNRDETRRFLSLFETTLLNRKILNDNCKKYYSCMVFREAIKRESFPKLSDLEIAILNVFGIVVEQLDHKLDLIPTVKMYYEIATSAFKGISCSHQYPCSDDDLMKKRVKNAFATKFSRPQIRPEKN